MNRAWRYVLLALALLALVAGTLVAGWWLGQKPIVDADQPRQGASVALEPDQPLGQTFVARHDGLAGIEFFLLPTTTSPLTLTLHLRSEPAAPHDLAASRLQLPPGAKPGFYRFALPQQRESHSQYYYAFLQASAPGISLALAGGAAYLDGAAHQAHQPLDAQTAFHLVYAPGAALLGLLQAALGWTGLLVASGLLFVLPGWALLVWLLPGKHLSWPEVLGLAVGISLALYPVFLLWTGLLGLRLGPMYAWLPVLAGLLALIWRYRSWRPRNGWATLQGWARSAALWPDLTLVILLALVLVVRLLVVRSLDAPLWGDSFQHTLIAQLLVENGGLFDSWAPYADLQTLTYHFGFHTTGAAMRWLTGLPMQDLILWVGQLLNALAVLALYPLALRVTGSRWGATWAVLLAGLLSPMPMAYTNWGRYTQLAGQVILPAAVWLTWEVVERPTRRWGSMALAALVAGGLALTHYRVLIFYGAFMLALLVVRGRGDPAPARRETLLRLVGVGAGVSLLFTPWLAHNLQGTNLQLLGTTVRTAPAQAPQVIWDYNAIGDLSTYMAPIWWLALLLGLGVGLWQRQRSVLLMAVWWLLLLLATNPAWLSLPGTGAISNFALFIFAYLPAGIFSGVLVARLVPTQTEHGTHSDHAEQVPVGSLPRRGWRSPLAAALLVILGLWGVRDRLGDLDPAFHTLVTRPDVRAASWIEDNTAAGARFLVNSFSVYADSSIVGSDGGWWLPLLAGRQTTVPPLNYSSEQGPTPDYRWQVNELAQQVQESGPTDERVMNLLRQAGVTHVYIGQRQGRVNYDGPVALDPEALLAHPDYDLQYHQDRVWIFALSPLRQGP